MGTKASKEQRPVSSETVAQNVPDAGEKESSTKGNPENDEFQSEAEQNLMGGDGSGDCDYYTYQETDTNVFQVWKRYKDEGKISISWAEFEKLNEGTDLTAVKPGDKLCFPKGTFKPGFTVAGDPDGARVIRVAWTIDDGPQTNTSLMDTTGLGGLPHTTWYVQRNRIGASDYAKLKAKQDAGGEIAIHSFHKTLDHVAWFPLKEGFSNAMDLWPKGTTEDQIMTELKAFHAELKTNGINPAFVRLPTGLDTELDDYGMSLGLSSDNAKKIRRKIINGESIAADGDAAATMLKDFNKIKDTLNELNLWLWGGAADAHTISSHSWQAEASGSKGRVDDVTKTVSPERSAANKDDNPGAFERKVDKMIADGKTSTSLVVLAHDTLKSDAAAVAADKKAMEAYALSKKVKIEYHTMSSLFKNVTGENATLDVNYKKN